MAKITKEYAEYIFHSCLLINKNKQEQTRTNKNEQYI